MSSETVEYTDDLGEMDGIGPEVPDFLPPPEELASRLRADRAPRAVDLPRPTAAFLRCEAARNRVRYQRLIRALVDGQARRV